MVIPDTCPECGSELVIMSKEWLIAHQRIEWNGDTPEWGITEPIYETSQTEEYFCANCLASLPEPLQEELDKALNNTRSTPPELTNALSQ